MSGMHVSAQAVRVCCALVLFLLGSSLPQARVSAAPMLGYSFYYGLYDTAEPKNRHDSKAQYDQATTDAIYARIEMVSNNGSPDQDFLIDIRFYDPDNKLVPSSWVQGDSAKVTSVNEERTGNQLPSGHQNYVTRRMLKVNGNAAANKPGTWTVDFRVNGTSQQKTSFELTMNNNSNNGDDPATAAHDELQNKGYTVTDVSSGKYSDSNGTYARVIMLFAGTAPFSADTEQQVVDGLAVLYKYYQNQKVGDLQVALFYNDRYDLVYIITLSDYAAAKQKDWNTVSQKMLFAIFDRQTQTWVEASKQKDFINKNFGGGTNTNNNNGNNNNGNNTNSSLAGSISFDKVPTSLNPDGKSKVTLTITVKDKSKTAKPLPDYPVKFSLSDPALGQLRPTETTTDENGQAEVTFVAGTRPGTVVIRANAGTLNATATIVLTQSGTTTTTTSNNTGITNTNTTTNTTTTTNTNTTTNTTTTGTNTTNNGDDDSAQAAEVHSTLEMQNYEVLGVGYMSDNTGTRLDAVFALMKPVTMQWGATLGKQVFNGWDALSQAYPNVSYLVVIFRIDHYQMYWPVTRDEFNGADINDTDFWNKVVAPKLYVIDINTGKAVNTQNFVQKNFGTG